VTIRVLLADDHALVRAGIRSLLGAMAEVAAQPYPYRFEPRSTALLVIDMQRDFVEPGGFGEALGNDVGRLSAIVPTVRALLDWARRHAITVLHTREGHRPDLADCPPAKQRRGDPALRIGAKGPMGRILVDGEPGNDIVPALAPLAGEPVIVKPGKGAFYATALDEMLRSQRITHLLLAGRPAKGRSQVPEHGRGQRVALIRAIEGDGRHVAVDRKQRLLEGRSLHHACNLTQQAEPKRQHNRRLRSHDRAAALWTPFEAYGK